MRNKVVNQPPNDEKAKIDFKYRSTFSRQKIRRKWPETSTHQKQIEPKNRLRREFRSALRFCQTCRKINQSDLVSTDEKQKRN